MFSEKTTLKIFLKEIEKKYIPKKSWKAFHKIMK